MLASGAARSVATHPISFCFFFFNDTATTEIYTLSLHDALPIYHRQAWLCLAHPCLPLAVGVDIRAVEDRKSTRLNSSHGYISYAVFCLKKKKNHRAIPAAGSARAHTYSALARKRAHAACARATH